MRAYGKEIALACPEDMMLHDSSPKLMAHDSQGRTSPHVEFPFHVNQISSPSFEWITIMTLNEIALTLQDCIYLTKLPNLGALYLDNWLGAKENLTEVMVRAWSRAARENGAFKVLKLLVLWTPRELKPEMWRNLGHLPALRVLSLAGEWQFSDLELERRIIARWSYS